MKSSTFALLAAALTLAAGCANPERSRNLADPLVAPVTLAQQVCANCHGMHGSAVSPNFPNLAGQHADISSKQLVVVFQRTDERPAGSIMKVVAHELTQQNIADVAAFLQALPNR